MYKQAGGTDNTGKSTITNNETNPKINVLYTLFSEISNF